MNDTHDTTTDTAPKQELQATMSRNAFIPKYTHPFTLEEAMLLEIDILVQGKLHLSIRYYPINRIPEDELLARRSEGQRLIDRGI